MTSECVRCFADGAFLAARSAMMSVCVISWASIAVASRWVCEKPLNISIALIPETGAATAVALQPNCASYFPLIRN